MICNRLNECVAEHLLERASSSCANRNPDRCMISSDRRSKVQCEEKKKKYILDNTGKNLVLSYKLDGGIIVEDKTVPQGTNKCDYMFVVDSADQSIILIELKGVDVRHALQQLYGTLRLFDSFFTRFPHVYGRIIVSSLAPQLKASPEYVHLQKLLMIKYKGNIKIIEKQFTEPDTDLDKISK